MRKRFKFCKKYVSIGLKNQKKLKLA